MTANLRPCSAEGRSVGSSSGSGVECASSGAGEVEGGDEVEEVGVALDGSEEGSGLGESAKCRACVRTLHCRQVDVDGRSEGRRLGIRRDCLAVFLDEAIESKKILGTNRASGCMAGVPSLESWSGG